MERGRNRHVNLELVPKLARIIVFPYVVDKVLVNNGVVIGEYNVATDQNPTDDSIIPDQIRQLQYLPQTDTTEYILNWFTKQRHSTGNSANLVDSIAKSLGPNSTAEYSDADGSLAESDCAEESKRYDPKWITFRKVCCFRMFF